MDIEHVLTEDNLSYFWLKAYNKIKSETLSKAGGTLSGDLDMSAHYIKNVKTPLRDTDAATKKYVDEHTGAPDHHTHPTDDIEELEDYVVELIEEHGGGGGPVDPVVLTNLSGSTSFTVPYGSDVNISFSYRSKVDPGNGVLQIYVNDLLKTSYSIPSGTNVVNVGEYINDGSNTVRIQCRDAYGNFKALIYTVDSILLRITSTFDDSLAYSEDIQYKYTPYGIGTKTVHFILDGVETTQSVDSTGRVLTKNLTDLTHGKHTLTVYESCNINGVTIESDSLYHEIIFIEQGNTDPILVSSFYGGTFTQGDSINVPYVVYDPLTAECSVDLSIYEYVQETAQLRLYSTKTVIADRTRQVWSITDVPVGNVILRLSYGSSINNSKEITVTSSGIDIEPVTDNLVLYLSSSGRSNTDSDRDVWTYNNISTEFSNFNWVNTGWVPDIDGNTALHLSGKAVATINYKPFDNDAKLNGKTIELEFAIRDVNNRTATPISCMVGRIGFIVKPDRAYITSEQSKIECNFSDNERVKVAFVIEPKTDYRMLSIYLNGVLSGAIQYPTDDNFQQSNPVYITVGSEECSIDLYNIRVYSSSLSYKGLLDNYIYDISKITDKILEYNSNSVCDSQGNISYSLIKNKIPVMIITGDLPQSKGDKHNVTITYEDYLNPSLNFEDTASIDVQGTSSQWYVRKNYKIKCSAEHVHSPGKLPSKVFCMKADYAECTGTHNTQNANFVHTLYTTKTPAQELNDKCRTTVYGFPCVIFHRPDTSSDLEFIGKYNFNYDKGSLSVYGFEDFENAQSWEFLNNTSDACNFKDQLPTDWTDDFEARYPEDCDDISSFKTMHDWVVSTKGNVTKFKNEFSQHFNLQMCLTYYVYTSIMLMVDQRAKNMFLTTWDGIHWEPWFYDNDTCLGINNEGALVFDYYHEDIDQLEGANVYNGQESVLWCNFKEAFADEIKSYYQSIRNNKKLTYDLLYEYFITNGSSKWAEIVYNEDEDFKYVVMLREDNDATNLPQIRGTGESHFRYFMSNRIKYLDSKWYASDYADDYISLRIYTPSGTQAITPNADITVTPYSTMYAGVKYKANGTLVQHRVSSGEEYTFEAPDEQFNDTETGIYGASQISDIGDLAPLYCGSVNVSKATKLVSLKIGDGTVGYSNPNLISLSIGTNNLLKTLDIQNCPNLTSSVDVSGCPSIETIKATGSGITSVTLPESGYLKTLCLPETITSLVVKNQPMITMFSVTSYSNIATLVVEGSDNIPISDIVNNAPNLSRIRIINANFTVDAIDTVTRLTLSKGIDEHGNNVDYPVITGTMTITCMVSESQVAAWEALWPGLTIIATNIGYKVTFKGDDGTVLKEQIVISGQSATPPMPPQKESTAQYNYIFTSWSNPYTNVQHDVITIAQYSESLRQYTVSFYNGTTKLFTQRVYYGSSAVYEGDAFSKEHSDPGNFYWQFDKWYPSIDVITGDADTYAQYTEVMYPILDIIDLPTTSAECVAYFDDYLVVYDGSGNAYISYDLGGNWATINTTPIKPNDTLNNMKIWYNEGVVYYCARYGYSPMYMSLDGINFHKVLAYDSHSNSNTNNSDVLYFNESVYVLKNNGVLYRCDFVDGVLQDGIYLSTVPINGSLRMYLYIDNGAIILLPALSTSASKDYYIYKSLDNGATWEKIFMDNTPSSYNVTYFTQEDTYSMFINRSTNWPSMYTKDLTTLHEFKTPGWSYSYTPGYGLAIQLDSVAISLVSNNYSNYHKTIITYAKNLEGIPTSAVYRVLDSQEGWDFATNFGINSTSYVHCTVPYCKNGNRAFILKTKSELLRITQY